ncbi:hypothetical protein KAFR_0K02200 [Kazachstania africana CBS 2517]|uniref:CRIB domain-containing protein n=1 Tax=Kazachstania africana (strain ATCC 22294 / BCRC 22015 / CBS 2517 / CECT 1963 / NBRC 1671 / NRRL Y-8276) TaxID=1071382 RepID=H2B1S4_KAZAF|nr:hypothetical protein KAFR_0K02200 [Kazachstania africana CBS 2517]CCF60574.1 hypothetical protein KAFR_0K02200 [Kazachstania africana CBS 2517]
MSRIPNSESTRSLPKMKSIWIDEDEENEKLYGLQYALEHADGLQNNINNIHDEDDGLKLTLLNSCTPYLPETKKLKKIASSSKNSKVTAGTKREKKSIRGKLVNIITSMKSSPQRNSFEVSKPFGFQHISHGDFNESSHNKLNRMGEISNPVSPAKTLSRIFVTEKTTPNSNEGRVARSSNGTRISFEMEDSFQIRNSFVHSEDELQFDSFMDEELYEMFIKN